METFLELVKDSRKELKEARISFWSENKANFKKNIKKIIDLYKIPRGWKVYVVASNFLFDRKIFPFDYDSWSSTNLIAATKKQGFEVMIFFNKARLEFLSAPALIPIVEHEMVHVIQAAKNPQRYLNSLTKDLLSKKLEMEAEKKVKHISDEFRKQWVLESIVYCYDSEGWEMAKRMADFFHEEMENMYGGGYDKGMTDEEYEAFLKAQKQKDIDLFIDSF
jgi:hypothetical protein